MRAKRAAKPAANPRSGFQPIDWALVDPDHADDSLLNRFRNLSAAKKWAKMPLDQPLDDATTRAYMSYQKNKHETVAEAAQSRINLTQEARKAVAESFEEAVERRLAGYQVHATEMLPNDIVQYRELCRIEERLEQANTALATVSMTDEADLRVRVALNDEWGKLQVQHRELQKSLNITKSQRDSEQSGKSTAEMFTEDMAKTAKWMDDRMWLLVCSNPACQAEILWLWWAYDEVHDPKPLRLEGVCKCGTKIALSLPEARTRKEKGEAA